MNSIIQLNVPTARRLAIATAFGVLVALGVTGATFFGSVTPSAAAEVRDHRTKPVVRDHRDGAPAETRDHRTGASGGGVTVSEGKTRPRKVPCYGNLCGVKVCGASVCL